jgi:DNA-binding MarR family transcriptional regulator
MSRGLARLYISHTIVRIMPKFTQPRSKWTPLDALMPLTRQRVLAVTLLQPGKWQYLTGLAQQLRARPSSLYRELTQLVKAGIIERRKDGNRVYFRPAKECPFQKELTGLVRKTRGKLKRQ